MTSVVQAGPDPIDASDSGGIPQPIRSEEFAGLMAAFAPFETCPRVAVGVSGGPDSMALALLVAEWARPRGGECLALLVDHGLRSESAEEISWAGQELERLGVPHESLSWSGEKPATRIQERARGARYELLEEACARRGMLHLALAHHRDDQAETGVMRHSRASGPDGLAGMSASLVVQATRVIRPLLTVAKARLRATLEAKNARWVEDPSNRDERFLRVRIRKAMADPARSELSREPLAERAADFAAARRAREEAVARLLARSVSIFPEGFARLDAERLTEAPSEVGRGALKRLLSAIGGRAYPARSERLARAHARLAERGAAAFTLAGCRLVPRTDGLLVCREQRHLEERVVEPGATVRWDDRFEIALARDISAERGKLVLGPLDAGRWRAAVDDRPELRKLRIPREARVSLPCFSDSEGPIAIPSVGYQRAGTGEAVVARCLFSPPMPLSAWSFTVVSH